MITKTKEVYYCEHCNKHMLNKGTMLKHEKYCLSAPENKHKCFQDCQHLKRYTEKQEAGYMNEITVTMFRCVKLDKTLYSAIAERRDILRYDQFTGAERMPLECADFEHLEHLEADTFL